MNKASLSAPCFLSGSGEMEELTRTLDWSQTPVGKFEEWPISLRTIVSVVLSSKFPMFLWWGEELTQFYNDAYRPSLGNEGKHPTALGQKGKDCWPEIWPVIYPLIQQVLAGGSTWSENQLIPIYRNGHLEDVYWTFCYSPARNDEGIINGVLVTCTETTKQVLTEKHLKKQLSNLFLQAPVALCIFRGENHMIEVANERMLELWGKNAAEVLNKPLFEAMPDAGNQGYEQLLDEVYKTGKRFIADELRITLVRHGKSEGIFVKFVYEPLREEDGTITGIMALADEITEQVLARKESEEVRERFETLANNIPNLAWIANADGYIFWFNNRWYEYTGTTPQEMIGWGWKSVHDPSTFPSVLENWQYSIQTGKPLEMVFPLKGADNVFRPFLTRVVPIYNNQGKLIRWLGTNTDITKQKEVERMKDNFLSIASHELKTPVTTIKAYGQIAESMLEANGDTQTLGMIKKMGAQINKLNNLIDGFLDITKIQKGTFIYNDEVFNMKELLQEVVADMQSINKTHEIESAVVHEAFVFGDKNKISQVLNNLISNAIKYSPGANRIIVDSEIQKDGVQVSVRDFGIGIPEDEVDHVFEQFYRIEGNYQNNFPGMGIGLYICAEIIKRHRGKIWVDSIEGKGSIFYVWLPFDFRLS
ncbi:PAS domain-containing protein [Ginsengibacter hankyongi]|uniref:histidine kinase n=1 Tax=Ginsengibacter hankyongi TaxID=2607284 RepID=A0A5J5IHK0_9BACT|nr:PAS domain-containing protein [Ginsengibacter hankyongi]KAA9038570.1 PAS domain-containing protein [Ginsengibacter hankyongi]